MNLNQFNSMYNIYIVGAHSRAGTLTGYLHFLYPHIRIAAYLVEDRKENPSAIDGVPVMSVEDADFSGGVPVFIATKGAYHEAIAAYLTTLGAETILPVTVELDNLLRNAYVKKWFGQEGRSFVKLEELAKGCDIDTDDTVQSRYGTDNYAVYMAKSIYDKMLQIDYEPADYEIPIQVGAALTKERLGANIATDHTGDHISERNRQYCELTALYWLWKNSSQEVVGLCHYRRHFLLPMRWQQLMEEFRIDAILPVPSCVLPSLGENYEKRHDPSDWECLRRIIREKYTDYEATAEHTFRGNLYLPCNMFIMKRGLLDRLCSFLFPILEEVWLHGGQKEDVYQNRYPGFISERLITLFFAKHQKDLKIVYADKNFLK